MRVHVCVRPRAPVCVPRTFSLFLLPSRSSCPSLTLLGVTHERVSFSARARTGLARALVFSRPYV